MNVSGANSATAIAAALQEDGHGTSNRRSLNLKNSGSRGLESHRYTSSSGERWPLGDAFSSNGNLTNGAVDDDSAVVDDFLSPNTLAARRRQNPGVPARAHI